MNAPGMKVHLPKVEALRAEAAHRYYRRCEVDGMEPEINDYESELRHLVLTRFHQEAEPYRVIKLRLARLRMCTTLTGAGEFAWTDEEKALLNTCDDAIRTIAASYGLEIPTGE